MKIYEFGTEHPKTLLFFPGSCEHWMEYREPARLLAAGFHVYLVAPDGHDPEEHTDFISVERTVDDAVAYLRGHGVEHLNGVYGLSFGGGMAIHMLSSEKMGADRAVIDAGTAPYVYPKWLCKLICVRDYLQFKAGIASIRGMALAFPPERFARDKAHWEREYGQLQRYLKTYSDRTIWNIFWSANNYSVPKAAPRLDTRIQFWVGTEEWGSRYRDLKWAKGYLPQMEVVKIPGMMHGEYVMMHPEAFAKQALAFFGEQEA